MKETIDERLARLTRATEHVTPRADFSARVMRSIAHEAQTSDPFEGIARAGKRFVGVALLAATVALGFALRSERSVTQELAVSYDAIEVDW